MQRIAMIWNWFWMSFFDVLKLSLNQFNSLSNAIIYLKIIENWWEKQKNKADNIINKEVTKFLEDFNLYDDYINKIYPDKT